MESITCTICKIPKNILNYGFRDGGKYIKHQCKQCLNEKSKQRHIVNREYDLNRHRKYKEKHNEQFKEKHICQCGGSYNYQHKTEHERTQKHQNFINGNVKAKTDQVYKKLVKYWDFDEKEAKEIKLLPSVVDKFHLLKFSNKPHLNNYEALKAMKLI